jgi:hypothetical protein
MPSIGLAREKRRLEAIAKKNGCTRAVARGIATKYFASLLHDEN